jgi:hypothetical protein
MMSSYQSRISLWRVISTISHWPTERSSKSSPIVGREEIEVLVKWGFRLILDNLHDLVDCIQPVLVDEGWIFGVGVVWSSDFEETAKGVELVLIISSIIVLLKADLPCIRRPSDCRQVWMVSFTKYWATGRTGWLWHYRRNPNLVSTFTEVILQPTLWVGARPDSGGGWKAPTTSASNRRLDKWFTAVRVLGNIPRLSIDHSFDKQSQVLIMRQQSIEMSELISSIPKPLGSDILFHQLTWQEKEKGLTPVMMNATFSSGLK